MHYPFFLLAMFIAHGVSAESTCTTTIPIHKVVSYGIMPITDEQHAPRIRGTVYNTLDCDVDTRHPTGSELEMNRTRLTQSGSSKNSCEIKNINGTQIIDSFQAIVLETSGWLLNDVNFEFHDVDSSTLGWKEAGAVFGLRNGTIVTPKIALSGNTVLSSRNFSFPAESARIANLKTGEINNVPGFLYASSGIVNCHMGMAPERCRAQVSFSSPVDTVAIIYMMTARGSILTTSGASLSQLDMACGCRCRKVATENKVIAEPAPGTPEQCITRSAPREETICHPSGENWCKIEPRSYYQVTGNTLPNGNINCEERTTNMPVIQVPYSPAPSFSAYL